MSTKEFEFKVYWSFNFGDAFKIKAADSEEAYEKATLIGKDKKRFIAALKKEIKKDDFNFNWEDVEFVKEVC